MNALESRAPASISGVVTHTDGRIVPGALVQLRFAGELPVIRETRSGPDGGFAFEDLQPARYDLELQGASFAAASFGVMPAPGQAQHIELEVDSPRLVQIEGVVRDVRGSAARNALVQGSISGMEHRKAAHPSAVHTDDAGRFLLSVATGFWVRRLVVRVYSPDGSSSLVQVEPSPDSDRTLRVTLDPPGTDVCRGIVLAANGAPAEGATVTTWPSRTKGRPLGVGLTDARGAFIVAATSAHRTFVTASLHGDAASSMRCEEDQPLRLSVGATLRGRVPGAAPAQLIHGRTLPASERRIGNLRREGDEGAPFEFFGHRFSIPNLPIGEPVDVSIEWHGAFSVELPGPGLWELDEPL